MGHQGINKRSDSEMNEKIRKVAVVGTGTLGTQISILSAHFGYIVSTYDTSPESFKNGLKNLKNIMEILKKKTLFSIEDIEEAATSVFHCRELEEAVRDADVVIESVPENLELKREVFKQLDSLAPSRALLATNSSSLPISRIEDVTMKPDRCLNIHFYSPVTETNMADIMGGTRTSAETIETASSWVRSLGYVPLIVKKETLGFCFNRIWRAVKREALHMWAGGFVDFRDIDRGWMIAYGTPQGPFGMMDRVGLDVVYDIEMVYYNESKDPRDYPPEALRAMVDRKELGIKTNKGFYRYPDPEYTRPDFLQAEVKE